MYQNTASLSRVVQESAELSDAHCHLNLFENPDASLRESIAGGVRIILATGGSALDNAQVGELAKRSEVVFGIVGISPDFAESDGYAIEGLEEMVKKNEKIIGIGEIGLDFKIANGEKELLAQMAAFERQIEIANGLGLPMVIHSRGSLGKVIGVLDKHKAKRVMFHFFEGDGEWAREIEKRGWLISIPPVENKNRKEAIREINVKNIVVETDSPVVGKSPLDVKRSLEMISKIKGTGVAELAKITTENLREFFYI